MNDSSNHRPHGSFARWITAACSVLPLLSAHAHPGHALHESTLGHAFSSPFHISSMAAAGLMLWLASGLVRQKRPAQTLRAGSMVLLAGACVAAFLA